MTQESKRSGQRIGCIVVVVNDEDSQELRHEHAPSAAKWIVRKSVNGILLHGHFAGVELCQFQDEVSSYLPARVDGVARCGGGRNDLASSSNMRTIRKSGQPNPRDMPLCKLWYAGNLLGMIFADFLLRPADLALRPVASSASLRHATWYNCKYQTAIPQQIIGTKAWRTKLPILALPVAKRSSFRSTFRWDPTRSMSRIAQFVAGLT